MEFGKIQLMVIIEPRRIQKECNGLFCAAVVVVVVGGGGGGGGHGAVSRRHRHRCHLVIGGGVDGRTSRL
jgi:hypothetical protein